MLLATLINIPRRIIKASQYSWAGLKSAFIKEEAFRLEIMGLIILGVTLGAIDWPGWKKLALVAAFGLIPLAELVNSALEDICDLISPDFNPLIKSAKDKGSAAVLVAIIINLLFLAALILI